VAAFAAVRAIDWIWRIAWGSSMTRLADALQLPLATANVAAPPKLAGGGATAGSAPARQHKPAVLGGAGPTARPAKEFRWPCIVKWRIDRSGSLASIPRS
jgi:hypothetical protein